MRAWRSHYGEDKHELEKVQRRATKMVEGLNGYENDYLDSFFQVIRDSAEEGTVDSFILFKNKYPVIIWEVSSLLTEFVRMGQTREGISLQTVNASKIII